MTQMTIRRTLPGTSYVVDLVLDNVTNTGRVVLEKTVTTAVEAQKKLSDLSLRSIQGVLLDLLESKGLYPNPRIISRVLEDLTEPMEPETEPPTSAAEAVAAEAVAAEAVAAELPEMPSASEVKQEVSPLVASMTANPLLKVKDIMAAANAYISKLDNIIGSPGLPDEIGSTMKAIQDLLVQAKNVINDILSS